MLIAFDFDGTLVDSRRCILTAMARALAERELAPPPDAALLATVGLRPPAMPERLFPGQDPATRDFLADRYRTHSIALRAEQPDLERPFAGALEILQALQAEGHDLAIVTGKSRRGLDQCLGHFGWGGYFSNLQPAENAPGKPDPGLLLRAMDETGNGTEDTVMVGDTTFDMEMARRARVRPIGVAWGYHPAADLTAAGAAVVVESFVALQAIIGGR